MTTVKCVVWDLDNTVWDGVLLEDGDVKLRPGVVEVIRTLDGRGILHSIASRNDHDAAMAKLEEFGIAEYFLYPQITWDNKSDSIRVIAETINIGIDTLAFVDDQPFERDEVSYAHPQVLCVDALDAERLPDLPRMQPRFVTEDSRERHGTSTGPTPSATRPRSRTRAPTKSSWPRWGCASSSPRPRSVTSSAPRS